jgi:hypothetical protein
MFPERQSKRLCIVHGLIWWLHLQRRRIDESDEEEAEKARRRRTQQRFAISIGKLINLVYLSSLIN